MPIPEQMMRASILVVEDSSVDLEIISIVCASLNCLVDVASDGLTAVQLYSEKRHTLVLTDYKMEPLNGIDVVAKIRHVNPDAFCMIMTGYPDQIIRRFARDNDIFDLVTKPIGVGSLLETLRVALDRHGGATLQTSALALSNRMDRCLALLGESSLIGQVRENLCESITSKNPLLIEGPVGVGKPGIVRLLHDCGPYGESDFIECDCDRLEQDALSAQLIGPDGEWGESLENARNGTLVLYHPQALPLEIQKILALHFKAISASMRIISVAHLPLEDEMSKGRLDVQLYFEIAMETVKIPSLAERPEDVDAMVRSVATSPVRFALARLLSCAEIDTLAEKLSFYDLPGNQAELIERVRRQSQDDCVVDSRF